MPQQTTTKNAASIAHWLFACASLVFIMVIVGAITRLTNSGLSIVEWQPIMGAIPPLNEDQWMEAFEKYKQFPEYRKQHYWMDLDDFKMIFFWEWFHRLLGRLIGLVYALPLAYFWIRGMIPKGYKLKLFGMLILGGMQGVMGWYMVKSGLIDQPDVSHYRLAMHLSLAFLIVGFLVWVGLSLKPPAAYQSKALYRHSWITLAFYTATVFWGAYTAGLGAGLIYNDTFPKMGEGWLPHDMWQLQPHWVNFFETPSAVQFTHRWLAIATTLVTLGLFAHGLYRKINPAALYALAAMIVMQAGLGIATLFTNVSLPIATMHQGGAVVVLVLLITCMRQFKGAPAPTA